MSCLLGRLWLELQTMWPKAVARQPTLRRWKRRTLNCGHSFSKPA